MQYFLHFSAKEERLLRLSNVGPEGSSRGPEQQRPQQQALQEGQRPYHINNPHQAPAMVNRCMNETAKEMRACNTDMIVMLHKQMREIEREIADRRMTSDRKYKEYQGTALSMRGKPPQFTMREQVRLPNQDAALRQLEAEIIALEKQRDDLVKEIKRLDRMPVHGGPGYEYAHGSGMPMGAEGVPGQPFNIELTLQHLPPEVAQMVRELPPQFQESVARMLDGLTPAEMLEAKNLLAKVHKMSPAGVLALMHAPIMDNQGRLLTKEAMEKTPGAMNEPGAKELAEFLGSLTPVERQLFERTLKIIRFTQAGPEGKRMGRPLEVENPDIQQKVRDLVERYNSATTEKQQMMAEGLLRISGVDVERSNLKTNQIFMLPDQGPEKFFALIAGLLQIVTAMQDKESKPLKKGNEPENVPAPSPDKMKSDERKAKIEKNTQKIQDLEKEDVNLKKRIEELDAGKGVTPLEVQAKRQEEQKKLEVRRTDIKKEIAALKAENKALQEAQAASEKKEDKELTPDRIKEKFKALIKKKIAEAMKQPQFGLISSGESSDSYIERLASAMTNAITVKRMENGTMKITFDRNTLPSESFQENRLMIEALHRAIPNHESRDTFYGPTFETKPMDEAALRRFLELPQIGELPQPTPAAPKPTPEPTFEAPKPPVEEVSPPTTEIQKKSAEVQQLFNLVLGQGAVSAGVVEKDGKFSIYMDNGPQAGSISPALREHIQRVCFKSEKAGPSVRSSTAPLEKFQLDAAIDAIRKSLPTADQCALLAKLQPYNHKGESVYRYIPSGFFRDPVFFSFKEGSWQWSSINPVYNTWFKTSDGNESQRLSAENRSLVQTIDRFNWPRGSQSA